MSLTDLTEDDLMTAAVVGGMLGLTDEESAEKFEREAEAIGSAMIAAGLAAATGTVNGENDEVEVDTYQMAVVSYGADKASAFLTKALQEAVANQAMNNLMGRIESMLTDGNAA